MPQPVQTTLSPAFHCGVARTLDRAGEIDAGDHREPAHHRRLAGQRQAVLVVQRRPFDAHGDVAVHQLGFVELGQRGGGALVRLVDPDRLERCHDAALPEPWFRGLFKPIRQAAQPPADRFLRRSAG